MTTCRDTDAKGRSDVEPTDKKRYADWPSGDVLNKNRALGRRPSCWIWAEGGAEAEGGGGEKNATRRREIDGAKERNAPTPASLVDYCAARLPSLPSHPTQLSPIQAGPCAVSPGLHHQLDGHIQGAAPAVALPVYIAYLYMCKPRCLAKYRLFGKCYLNLVIPPHTIVCVQCAANQCNGGRPGGGGTPDVSTTAFVYDVGRAAEWSA